MRLVANPIQCNICGGAEFVPAFQGRTTRGIPPACAGCGSYERHRIMRSIYSPLRATLSTLRALQFAPDISIDPAWFASFERSVFGGENSIDIADMKRAEGSLNLIISNHVLEHVPDHFAALREMVRVVGASGVVHLNVPTPTLRWETEDWGFADPEKNMHFRDYGADFAMLMVQAIPELKAMGVVASDPVTGIADIVYFFSQEAASLARFAHCWRGSNVATVRVT